MRARFRVTRQKVSALAIGDAQVLRGRLSDQTQVDNILNDLESVNFIQSEKLRCMRRHQNRSMPNLHDGHLNLAQPGHDKFAVTKSVRITKIMLNA